MGQYESIFLQLAIVLGLSAGIGYIMRLLKMPLVVAYLIAGVAISAFQIFNPTSSQAMHLLPEIGIAFVLFLVGMELDLQQIKYLGKAIVVSSFVQIILSIIAGFLIASALGFSTAESFYLGAGLSFSSTIVVIKMLSENKEINSLYGKLSIGMLLVEDMVAIVLLMGLTVSSSALNFGLQSSMPMITMLAKAILLLVLSLVLSRFVLRKVFSAVAKSQELLFLSALAWCFIFVSISVVLGFSVVVGAFLAGVALANSPFHLEIQGKVKPLRDFFVTVFFVYLGTQVIFQDVKIVLPLIGIFTLYALIMKPVIIMLILGVFGFRKHTMFQTALNLSQISEFSLIVLMVGVSLGVVSQPVLTAMALTGVLSIMASSIMISFSHKIYSILAPYIGFFEHSKLVHETEDNTRNPNLEDHVILVGGDQMGGKIINFLKKEQIPFLVLDFNPEVIKKLVELKINALYGDVSDLEILEFLNLEKARLLISTVPSTDDTLALLAELKKQKSEAVSIVRATSVEDAKIIYKNGADYVILPELVTGEVVSQILQAHWPNMHYFKNRSGVELGKLVRNQLAFT